MVSRYQPIYPTLSNVGLLSCSAEVSAERCLASLSRVGEVGDVGPPRTYPPAIPEKKESLANISSPNIYFQSPEQSKFLPLLVCATCNDLC